MVNGFLKKCKLRIANGRFNAKISKAYEEFFEYLDIVVACGVSFRLRNFGKRAVAEAVQFRSRVEGKSALF